MPNLKSARSKLERGSARLEELWRALSDAFDDDEHDFITDLRDYPYPKRPVDDPRDWRAFTVYAVAVPELPDTITHLLSETVQHFRNALDHVAWSFVKARYQSRLTAGQQRRIEFPMRPNRKDFWKSVGSSLRGTSPDDQRLFEQYQPYLRTDAGRAIRQLQILSNTDKHRTIVPVLSLPQTFEYTFHWQRLGGDPIDQVLALSPLKEGRPIRVGADLATFVLVGGTPGQRQVAVEGNARLVPFLPRTVVPPDRGEKSLLLEPALKKIEAVCTEFVEKAEVQLRRS